MCALVPNVKLLPGEKKQKQTRAAGMIRFIIILKKKKSDDGTTF